MPHSAANKRRWEETWTGKCEELRKFRNEQGHCRVHQGHESLGLWVMTQRKFYKSGSLSADRVSRLESIDFEWDAHAAVWEERFEELAAYKEQNGHCNVLSMDGQLGAWVNFQRQFQRRGRLPEERASRLRELGFEMRVSPVCVSDNDSDDRDAKRTDRIAAPRGSRGKKKRGPPTPTKEAEPKKRTRRAPTPASPKGGNKRAAAARAGAGGRGERRGSPGKTPQRVIRSSTSKANEQAINRVKKLEAELKTKDKELKRSTRVAKRSAARAVLNRRVLLEALEEAWEDIKERDAWMKDIEEKTQQLRAKLDKALVDLIEKDEDVRVLWEVLGKTSALAGRRVATDKERLDKLRRRLTRDCDCDCDCDCYFDCANS